MKVFKHTCYLIWQAFRGSQLSALDKFLLWPTFCIDTPNFYYSNILLIDDLSVWSGLSWARLKLLEKEWNMCLNCITRVYTFEKKWEVNNIAWHLKVCSCCKWSDYKWLCSWKTSTSRTSCTLYLYCMYYSTSLRPT